MFIFEIFKEKKLGDYQVVETKSPEGYKLNTTPISVSITEQERLVSVTVTNQPDTTRLRVLKTDKDGKALKGAQFRLEDKHGYSKELLFNEQGEPVDNWVLDLPDGQYTLTETRAPEGYALLPEPIEFYLIDGSVIVAKSNGDWIVDNVEPGDNKDSGKIPGDSKDKESAEKEVKLIVKNYKQGELPKFGQGGILGLIIGGGLLTLIAALSYRTLGRKETD